MNKITLLKIPQYKVSNKIEMIEMVVDVILILKKLKLSKGEKQVLCHFILEGYSEISKEQVVSSKILHTKNALNNTLTTFRKQGILVKEKFKEVLSPDFRFPISNLIKVEVMFDNN